MSIYCDMCDKKITKCKQCGKEFTVGDNAICWNRMHFDTEDCLKDYIVPEYEICSVHDRDDEK